MAANQPTATPLNIPIITVRPPSPPLETTSKDKPPKARRAPRSPKHRPRSRSRERADNDEDNAQKMRPRHIYRSRNCCHDDTVEYFDKFSNLEVGSQFDTLFRGERVGFCEKKPENYVYIVDLDSFEYHKIGFHTFIGEILQSAFFRFSILGLVLVNSILIGVNTHAETVAKYRPFLQIVEQVILGIFVFEIFLKWFYDFRMFWTVFWNILDFVVVLLILVAAIIPFIGRRREIFALVRVVRAFRILRSVSSLTSLNVVTHTIMKSMADMLSILLVLILFMLVMAVAGVTIFDLQDLETDRFRSSFDAWFVLFICTSQDGWVDILDEFRGSKGNYFVLICIYLFIGISIGAFVFTNLIVAVVVANLELAMRELRLQKQVQDNPLEFNGEFSITKVEVLPVYTIFGQQNIPLLGQRPMKIPSLKKISTRRLQAYIALIVAFEQNMLEFCIIERDYIKIMSVLLTIVKQLERAETETSEEDIPSEEPDMDALRIIYEQKLRRHRQSTKTYAKYG